jgi:hypothetical protein
VYSRSGVAVNWFPARFLSNFVVLVHLQYHKVFMRTPPFEMRSGSEEIVVRHRTAAVETVSSETTAVLYWTLSADHPEHSPASIASRSSPSHEHNSTQEARRP